MQFVDFFSGVGGIRLGLEQAGHECVGFCEWDKFARQSYKAMHYTEGEWESHDIRATKSYDVPDADLWCFGFPCQDISVAGKQKGLQEGKRSGLFYEIMRLLAGRRQEDRPKWLLIENVKNLLSIGNGFDFARLLCEVGGHGYSLQWDTLNSKDYGVPQNRERVFIDVAPALSISAWQENNLLADSIRIRRLTPRECWRLQGFPDEYFDKAKAAGISDTQLYKQAGNSVTVNVARAIGERLKEIENEGI